MSPELYSAAHSFHYRWLCLILLLPALCKAITRDRTLNSSSVWSYSMHCPVVTDNYIAAKMLIQLHLMSLWTFNWPIHHFWSFGLDCSILPAAPTYSTYNVQHHCAMSLQHSMSLWTFNWPIHHLLVIWPGLQYITCSTYLQYIQCTAPLCNVTAALNVTMDI